jgi:hypothetical protein
MNIKVAAGVLTGLLAISGTAIADDPASTPNQKSQSMKDCMDRQKATNSSMTQTAMETVCKNEAKNHKTKDGNDLATGQQAPKPQN